MVHSGIQYLFEFYACPNTKTIDIQQENIRTIQLTTSNKILIYVHISDPNYYYYFSKFLNNFCCSYHRALAIQITRHPRVYSSHI